MKNKLTISTIILFGVIVRLFPHVPNFAPIGALALFGGRYMSKKYAIEIVVFTMLISDYLLLYIHPFSAQFITLSHIYPLTALVHATTVYVYGSFIVNIGIGIWLKKHFSIQNLILASIISSLSFFLITNFGVWAAGAYRRDLSGLLESYLMGLPFLRPTVFGDLFYNGLFFASYSLLMYKETIHQVVKQYDKDLYKNR